MAETPPAAPQPLAVTHVRVRVGRRTDGNHPHTILTLVTRGDGEFGNGPRVEPVRAPFLSLLPAGDRDINGLSGPIEAWWCDAAWPAETLRAAPDLELAIAWGGRVVRVPRWKPLDPATASDAAARFAALRAALTRDDVAARIAATGRFLDLIGLFLDAPATPRDEEPALARFRALLEEDATATRTIAELARRAGASADHLRTRFRLRYGIGPARWRESLRLTRARALLAAGERVAAAARAVGYADPLHFSRRFSRHFGVPPSALRRYGDPPGGRKT